MVNGMGGTNDLQILKDEINFMVDISDAVLHEGEILELSQRIDELIVKYMREKDIN